MTVAIRMKTYVAWCRKYKSKIKGERKKLINKMANRASFPSPLPLLSLPLSFVEVECEFSEMGCTTMVMRKDLLKQMEENTHKLIILMSVLGSKMGGGSLELS